jgi:uncharacterized protein YndB with AHSA1/START domain
VTQRSVEHATITVERRYDVSVARVFAAWSNPAERARWDIPADDWTVAEYEQDFRVGGREASRFGPKGDPKYWSEGRYLDIVPNVRIVSAGTMHERERRTSATLCTVELLADGAGTRLILTDQSAFFDAIESPKDRESGWGTILGKLADHLERNPASR